jgi:uncharacterized membrane protein YbhN (UPF0104 family)
MLVWILVAERWRRLLAEQRIRVPLTELVLVNQTALFYGFFLPVGNLTGFLVRMVRIGCAERRWREVVRSLLLDRIWATAALGLVGVGFALVSGDREAGPWVFAFAGVAAAATLGLALLTGGTEGKLAAWAARVAPRFVPRSIAVELSLDRGPEPRFGISRSASFLLSVTSHLLGVVAYAMLAASVDLELPFVTVGWVRSATILVTMVPISVLGLGLREGAFLALLGSQGADPARVLALSALVFVVTILVPALFGAAAELSRMITNISRRAPRKAA